MLDVAHFFEREIVGVRVVMRRHTAKASATHSSVPVPPPQRRSSKPRAHGFARNRPSPPTTDALVTLRPRQSSSRQRAVEPNHERAARRVAIERAPGLDGVGGDAGRSGAGGSWWRAAGPRSAAPARSRAAKSSRHRAVPLVAVGSVANAAVRGARRRVSGRTGCVSLLDPARTARIRRTHHDVSLDRAHASRPRATTPKAEES